MSNIVLKPSFGIALCVALLLPPAAGSAQDHQAPAENVESAEYKQAVESALEEYRLQHYEEARSLFERAHALDPNARTLRGLGMVEFELRHYVRAAQLLEGSLASTQKPLTDEQRKAVEDLLGRTRQFIALYNLEVEPEPAALTVEIDGRRVDVGPEKKLSLEAGEHSLRISAPNAKPEELRIDVKGGEQQTIHIQLQVVNAQAPAPAPVAEHSKTRHRAALGLMGSGGAVVLGSAAVGSVAWVKANDAPTRDGSQADRAHAMAMAADVGFGVGIALSVVGAILRLTEREHAAPRAMIQGTQLGVRF